MSRQTHTQECGFSSCIRSDISLTAAANMYQEAGEQHEVIAQLHELQSFVFYFVC